MLKRIRFVQKNFSVVIPLMMLAGFLTGQACDVSALKQLILPLTFLMVYPMMIHLPLRKIAEGGDLKVQLVTQALAQMKRAHEYKVLVPDTDGKIEHVLTQEEILRHFAEEKK